MIRTLKDWKETLQYNGRGVSAPMILQDWTSKNEMILSALNAISSSIKMGLLNGAQQLVDDLISELKYED